MWKFILLFSLLGLLDLSSAQLVQFGQCNPNIQLVNNFNAALFTGKWYGTARTDSVLQSADCSTLELTATSNGFTVRNEAVNNNFYEEITGTATLEPGTAKFTLNVSVSEDPVDFWILTTDYSNFALAYACVNRGAVQRSVYIWQMGREPQFATDLMPTLMNRTLSNLLGITLNDLRTIEHSEMACQVLPNIPQGQAVILPGQCDPNITVVQNFNPSRFSGVWHSIASYYSDNQRGACGRAQYTLVGNVVNVVNSEVIGQALRTVSGTAVVSSDDNSARLTVSLEVTPGTFSRAELWVIGSDYDNYAVSYACTNLPDNQRRVNSWILSRSRRISSAAQLAVNEIINSQLDLNERFFTQSDQSDEACFYFPEPAPDRPVVFRGQCASNANVQAMPNFNAERYLGLWHNIESYPSIWQQGTCNNAYYSLGDDVVDVLNTQVVNQSLDVMKGFARLASTDGSAKLDVTFPVADTNQTVTIGYWVLDTDYDSYSLVYTCENLNEDEMQIWSWKLSRTKQLTAGANTAMNRVIDSIRVLDAKYYVGNDQSVDACFYFPDPQPGVPVEFPGRCDQTIPVVSNFNMNAFQGTWYEYQSYPKEQQTGQCISHEYTSGTGNTLNLVSSSVTDQFLGQTSGALSFSSTDGSGRLTVTMRTTEGDITFPFWILAVDYSDYAYAYSCVDVRQDFQRIFSWKLTRSPGQLSTTANTVINNIMSNHVVLDQRYYEDIDHSEDACFFFPDLAPGAAVIVPGQCDPNISVVQNFNAARYEGLWRLIESYPAEFQNGDCNDATYTLSGSSVIVYNTQVINQRLDTITGSAVLASNDGSGKLLVTFPGTPGQAEYWILDTDYDSYSLVYSCVNLDAERRRVWSWKLSRTDQLTQIAQANINRIVNSVQVLNNRFFEHIDRSDEACFYYPEPNPGAPVVFRGQCDENIPAVLFFNAGAYMNLWHDIQSYPTGFQEGTCNNAFYTLVDGEVDVFNTQVINQTLDTINGVARLVPTPTNDGKLIVSFPVAGTNLTTSTPYWVLATDYISFALVYTCVNLPNNQRQVYSWKLSRTKELTPNAINAINSITATIPVLRSQYYIERDQSPEGCFYFPDPEPGVPVVFPGQCDINIQAVRNFNMSAFEGTWHEIEAYPKDEQTGQCVSHDYTLTSANIFNLVSSSVADLNLAVTTSTAAITSVDGSGQLTITIPSGNSVVTIMFWILATDYTDYALAYSCVNVRADFRAVYSWKLSRTKQLSAQARVAINTAMQDNVVLGNQYFEQIDQSDEACFYLPEPVPGRPVVFSGQCDLNIPVVQNFQAARYQGRWRIIESYPTPFQYGSCQDATYTLNGTEVIVFNTQVVNETLDTITGTAVAATTDGSAKLLVSFPTTTEQAKYWVLDTDYDSYALVYSCRNLNDQQRLVTSWKLSRTSDLTPTAITNINRVVNSINVLNDKYYEIMDQSDDGCFYLPEPDTGSPVTFRGTCDQNIRVVTDFNPVRYMGLWHDIESYPTGFQEGTCNNAFYTLIGGEVDVFNTQVINQTLDTINGVARIASTDGSAKLTVTFPIVGTNLTTTTDYWVLATDYDSYALVYTCLDLGNDQRRVWSWKLSRQKQLGVSGQTAINAVVDTIPVLNSQYYIQRDQSRDGCFYFPEPEPGVPVVFPGQCDNTIEAVANFSLQAFQGLWHEIEAYPKNEQTGQCVNHEYSQGSGNTLNLVSSSVQDLTLDISTGNAAITSTDGSGRLNIVITSGGSTVTIPFWILDTDYTDYALAYSCVNLNQDYRGVYSWKLSRTRQLTVAANVAINNAIETIDVLANKYYEPIDQSDEACFYLPDLGPNEPVVFRGQCDQNIPVVRDFDPVRYSNRWRMIETYFSNSQTGTCIDATYTLRENGTVLVYNTQVNNEELRSIEGTAVLATTDGTGKLLVTFPGTPEPAEYWVLDTDYDTYALVYSCRNLNSEQRRVWSWKLSRTRELTPTAQTNINRIVNSINVLDPRYYQTIDHSDAACFYYPAADGTPLTFRGQCDNTIPVVANFDAVRYMNRWYDIESYPQAFQDGSCPTANYNLTDSGVEVLNTQVVRQQLDTMTGFAVPASFDNSAKLNVTFPIAGTDLVTTTPYWVLATDYDTYSLVYSCTNLNEDSRRVTSWKLSRTRALTPNAVEAINRVMATVPVLRQQYFNARGHTDDDCFYYPDNNGGPVILNGQCPTTQDVVTDFRLSNFEGNWIEVSRFPSELQNGECATSTLSVSGANTFTLTQTIVYNERQITVSGPVTAAADGRGILTARLSGSGVTIEKTLYVLSTDYVDHALIFSCDNLADNRKQIFSWKLARSRDGLSNASRAIIDDIVNRNVDLFEGYYEETDQSNNGCFHYPVFPETPEFITLPGPCDETIRAKANFNAAAYLGRWFEIASYPETFQIGECSRAEYIADGDTVRVVNSQVINKKLDIMIGSAVVASDDGSGLLNVSFAFDNGNVNFANYYVLDTDYTSFALVYSCRNLENNTRQVSSWKLSRTRTLGNEANTIIDRIVANTQGLLEDYYSPTRQDEDACFYIPDVNRDEAPRFRGQCADVTGVQNFDAQRYVGWWHEIESYPSDIDVGVCISSDFRASGNAFQVVDTNIFDVTAQVNTSTAVVTQNGRITKTFSDGRVQELWVLATDYETYSLLYSCENINDEYMRVWSAKHSKTRSLSTAAQDAMAPVIQNNRVLLPDFYMPVDQSDEACFHYPEQTGTRIILPGQCDPNIPVVQSFDAAEYTGTWYQIERYPQNYENGSCTGARYRLNTNTGVITVLNWQVTNGVLDVVEGSANVTSTDGSARLRVRLPVRFTDDPNPPMVETDLWILTTDYVRYSLAYTCVNIDEFNRAVGAWKLSRTRTMPNAGTTAIDSYMATRPELHQPFFQQVAQSDECEEPSSAILVKSSIIVLLICAVLQLFL
ncbi:uncharacterized protein [Epargyreus clarus]|uniref:uncharacterized protein n=1 Tax=Epargyreus clarus TaxID=520877 RepID=UPI003C2FDF3A